MRVMFTCASIRHTFRHCPSDFGPPAKPTLSIARATADWRKVDASKQRAVIGWGPLASSRAPECSGVYIWESTCTTAVCQLSRCGPPWGRLWSMVTHVIDWILKQNERDITVLWCSFTKKVCECLKNDLFMEKWARENPSPCSTKWAGVYYRTGKQGSCLGRQILGGRQILCKKIIKKIYIFF